VVDLFQPGSLNFLVTLIHRETIVWRVMASRSYVETLMITIFS